MRSRFAVAPLLVLAVALSGCFQISSVLTVRPEGSATLRDEVTMSGFALMAVQDAIEDDETTPEDLFGDPATYEERAASLGEDVRFVSVEAREDGYVALYAIPDVSALAFSMPSLPTDDEDGRSGPSTDGLDLTFAFDGGDPAELLIIVPKDDDDEKPSEDPDDAETPDPEQMAQALGMLRSFFADARLSITVEVEGEIIETNADRVDGSAVPVYDVPFEVLFDAMAENPELMQSSSPDDEATRAMLAGIEGLTIAEPGTVRVSFR